MEYLIENQAPSTEMSSSSHPISPIPLIPPNTLRPPNSTSLPSPPNEPLSSNPLVNRQILEPVPPSKRAATNAADLCTTGHTNEIEEANPYLPRELAEIFTARQRQERAWHTRLLVCTSFISCIDSTVSSFQDGAEKEMAKSVQVYLRSAISEFAAADTTPAIPKFSPKDSALKANGNLKSNLPKKPIVSATPRENTQPATIIRTHPSTISTNLENTWSVVARNGHKKSRAILTPATQIAQPAKQNAQATFRPAKKLPASADATPSILDKRLFVRLSNEHEWRKLSPAGIREVIVKKTSISPASIGTIKPVRSGFALSARNDETRQELLKLAIRLSPYDAKLEPASNWTSILVPTVPKIIYTLDGRKEVTKEMLADEIERVSSIRPASLRLYGRSLPNAPHQTWLAYFTKAPRPGFRVFDESGLVRKFKKQQPIDFCKRCNGHHSPKYCSRAPSCGNCGSTMHSEELCMALTKCKNCGGPHRSDSRKCLARPTRTGIPTKEQLKVYRQAGDREFQAIARAKAAEDRAATVEEKFSESSNSHVDTMNTDTNPTSSVEEAAGGAQRL